MHNGTILPSNKYHIHRGIFSHYILHRTAQYNNLIKQKVLLIQSSSYWVNRRSEIKSSIVEEKKDTL